MAPETASAEVLPGRPPRWRTWLARAIGLVLLLVVIRSVDAGEALSYYGRTGGGAAAAFVMALFGYQVMRAWRWQLLLRLQGVRVGLVWAYRVFMTSFFLGVLTPGRIGEMGRALFLKQEGHELGRSLVRVAIDRAIDAAVAVGLAVGVFAFRALPLSVGATTLVAGATATRRARWARVGSVIADEIRCLTVPGITPVLAVAVAAWLVYCAAILLLARGMTLPVGFSDTIGLVSIGAVAAFLPISVAGLGTREAALVALAEPFGLTREQALAFSGCILVSYLVSGLVGWACAVWTTQRAGRSPA